MVDNFTSETSNLDMKYIPCQEDVYNFIRRTPYRVFLIQKSELSNLFLPTRSFSPLVIGASATNHELFDSGRI
jgi:hypothetical protein